MSYVKKLKMQKDLYEWHALNVSKQIRKYQENCKHTNIDKKNTIHFDNDYGVYININTKKCKDCDLNLTIR